MLVHLLILVLVVGLLVGLALWAIDLLPVIPAPFKQFAKAIVIIIAIVIVIAQVLPLAGVAIP